MKTLTKAAPDLGSSRRTHRHLESPSLIRSFAAMEGDDRTQELARGAPDDNNRRFAELFRRTHPALFAWASVHVGSSGRGGFNAEDVVQETYLRALKAFARTSFESRPFRPWLIRIARNVVMEGWRRSKHTPTQWPGESSGGLDIPDEATSLTKRLASREEVCQLVETIAQLEPDDRKLATELGLAQESLQSVARELGISYDAARKRWTRLLTRLQGLLEAGTATIDG